jgi:DNA-binding MarR family transcriptional regulator
MPAPCISSSVARRVAAGLVARDPAGEDRRRVGLRVTAEGERVLRSVKSRRTAWLAARLRELSEEELEAVDRALGPLAELIDE